MKYSMLLLLSFWLNHSNAQIIEDIEAYKSFSDTLLVTQTYHFKNDKQGITQKTNYLGVIKDENQIPFKVLVSFIDLGGKGVNDLIFIAENNQFQYKLNLPTDAPYKIAKNKLYFRNENVTKTMQLNNSFQKLFCTPFECF